MVISFRPSRLVIRRRAQICQEILRQDYDSMRTSGQTILIGEYWIKMFPHMSLVWWYLRTNVVEQAIAVRKIPDVVHQTQVRLIPTQAPRRYRDLASPDASSLPWLTCC